MADMRPGRKISAPAVTLDELIEETRAVEGAETCPPLTGGGRQLHLRWVPGVLTACEARSVIVTARISKV
jgi:hypothetical protein